MGSGGLAAGIVSTGEDLTLATRLITLCASVCGRGGQRINRGRRGGNDRELLSVVFGLSAIGESMI